MRVKSRQIRAKVAFTKPLTTYLMRGKGDFSCRENGRFRAFLEGAKRLKRDRRV